MSQSIQFSTEEMAEINLLRTKFQEKMFQFGELYLHRMELDRAVRDLVDKEKKAQEEYINLQKMESELLDKIVKKYGEGNLDLTNGTFTSSG
jgi:hypothetical protein